MQRGMTLEDLARASGVSVVALQKNETGRRSLSLETLVKIAVGLGVRAGELFVGVDIGFVG